MLLITLALLFGSAQAATCDGRTTMCFDQCTNDMVNVAGDTCGVEFNYSKNCMAAKGNCSGSITIGNPSTMNNGCLGAVTCYDNCTNSVKTFWNSNACTNAYTYSKGCVEGMGYCKN